MRRFILYVGLLALSLAQVTNLLVAHRKEMPPTAAAAAIKRNQEKLDQLKIQIEAIQEQFKKLQAQKVSHKKAKRQPGRGVDR